MRKPITQKHDFGCGAACVAFVLDVSYERVVAVLDSARARHKGFTCKELVAVLGNFGDSYEYTYVTGRVRNKIYREGSIVFIKRNKNYPNGHYLARAQSGWMDPWMNLPTDAHIKKARSGFRKRLPGKPIYVLFKKA